MRDVPPRRSPRKRTLSRYSFQTGKSGTRFDTEEAPAREHTRDGCQRGLEIGLADE